MSMFLLYNKHWKKYLLLCCVGQMDKFVNLQWDCSDDNCSLLNKKSVLQTKYRPLLSKNRPNTDWSFWKYRPKFWNVIANGEKLRIGVLCQTWFLKVFILTSYQWNLNQSTQLSWIYTRRSKHTNINLDESPKIMTF